VKHHLNDHLDSIFAALTLPQQFTTQRLFRLLSERDSKARVIRRPLPYSQLKTEAGTDVDTVIEAFRDASRGRTFLMPPVPEPLSDSTIDISHECLLRRWDLLRSWVESEVRDARMFNLISEEADQADRQQLETGHRKPLAGAILDTYQAWRSLAAPTSSWARRYEGAQDQQLQRPLRQFEAAMEYLDWSAELYQASEVRSKQIERDLETSKLEQAESQLQIANLEARKQKLKTQRSILAAVVAVVIVVLIGLSLVVTRDKLAQLQLESKANAEAKKSAETYNMALKDSSDIIQGYAVSELQRLKANSKGDVQTSQTEDFLQGVIALSKRVATQSDNSYNVLNGKAAAPVAQVKEGWLFLGVLDKTGLTWTSSSVSSSLIFTPQLSRDQPIAQQLAGREVMVRYYSNLRDQGAPGQHSLGNVLQTLQPNTKAQIESVDRGTGNTVWAKVTVSPQY